MSWGAHLAAQLSGALWRRVAAAVFGALLAALAVQTVRIDGFLFITGLNDKLATARDQASAEVAAHRQTKANYTAAQAAAQAAQAARIARDTAQRKGITDDVASDYARQLAAARARHDDLAGRLRRAEAARSRAAGAAINAGVPALSGTAAGTAETASADGLSGATFPEIILPEGLTLAERWTATEQALQLDALIDWLIGQMRVPANDPLPEPIASTPPERTTP